MAWTTWAAWVMGVLMAALLAPAAHAGVWRERMVVELPIGERDTKSRVREGAIEEMRLRASRKVGTIVESTLRSDGARITEELKMVGVSLVQVDEVTDQVKVDGKGFMSLEVTATLTVDESELERRAAAMRVDGDKARKIKRLSDENEALRRSLEGIAAALRQKGTASDAADLLRRHAELTAALNDNQDRVGNTFAPGMIVDLSRQDAEGWARVESMLKEGVFERIMASTVRASIVNVEDTGSGYKAYVKVGWDVDAKAVSKVLAAQLERADVSQYGTKPQLMNVPWYANSGAGKTAYSQRVFRYLAANRVVLEFDLGGKLFEVPVLYFGDGFSNHCDSATVYRPEGSRNGGAVCLVSQSLNGPELMGVSYDARTNPIGVPLTREQARNATQVRASWVLKRPDGTSFRKSATLLGQG